ncbi:hypothetical protein D9619_005577 [Psilocybe cf. subviscida]|uniref:Uncharacterized protein n=1 Tax=Psilocybe cf. subviscida TaxID=2480587 RepID=A0A8H5BW80_9AGAR|nr:hypothetical protein D9619_005577 [Psilocybe cf. subviscida]
MFRQTMMETTSAYHSFPPSFQRPCQTVMNTGKRGRDSETEDNDSIDGRPLKRPFLAIGGSGSSRNSVNSSRQGSEDWVHAAGGLSIDSPLYTPSTIEGVSPFTGDVVSGNGSMGEDVDMLVESEETSVTATRPSLQMTFNSQQGEPMPPFTAPHDEKTPRRHNYGTRYAERTHSSTLPDIDITPATPVNSVPYGHRYFGSEQQFQEATHAGPLAVPPVQQELSDAMPMAFSPPPTHAETVHGSKRRIAFGLRANCEKCRLRIPGHFVHYD